MVTITNETCPVVEDPWQRSQPRDVRIQLYISSTLGLGAFLAFCVRPVAPPRSTALLIHIPVPPTTMERPLFCAKEAERLGDRAARTS